MSQKMNTITHKHASKTIILYIQDHPSSNYRLTRLGTGIFPKVSPRGTTTLSSFSPPLGSNLSILPVGFLILLTGRLVTEGIDSTLAIVGRSSGLDGIEFVSVSISSESTLRRRKASSSASRGSVRSHDCGTFQVFFFGVIPVGTSSSIPDDKKVEVEARTDLTFLLDSAYVWSNRSDAAAC